MKNILFFAIVFFTMQTLSAQVPKEASNENIYASVGVEVKPEFPGGMQEFYNFIGKNYILPNVQGLDGKVYVTFLIETDGNISDIKIIRDVGYGSGEEAIRVLKKSPQWIPGEQNGEKVRVQYALPIKIRT